MAAFSNSVPSNDLAGKSLPNCPMRVRIELAPYKGSSWVERLGTFLGSKILKADNTSFEEDLNWLDMLSLMNLIKDLPTLSWKEHISKWVTSIPEATFSSSLASCSYKTQFSEGSIASSSELRVASTGLEIRERSRCLVCKARLSFASWGRM